MKTALIVAAVLAGVPALAATPEEAAYRREIQEWRDQREARLKADGGWLTVTGLFWLKEGSNTVGSAATSGVRLPAAAPASVGTITLTQGKVTLQPAAGTPLTVDGTPAAGVVALRPDITGKPTVMAVGTLQMTVIDRSGRLGIRLKDTDSGLRKAFHGLEWYPIHPRHRVVAKWTPNAAGKTIPIPNVLGQVIDLPAPGVAEFTLGGKTLRLEPVIEEPGAEELFFIFRDTTASKTTYGGGRFLYSGMPKDGTVVIDFNKAYSPPCAFTPYATCPLPPKQNRLPVAVEAGEQFKGHHAVPKSGK